MKECYFLSDFTKSMNMGEHGIHFSGSGNLLRMLYHTAQETATMSQQLPIHSSQTHYHKRNTFARYLYIKQSNLLIINLNRKPEPATI